MNIQNKTLPKLLLGFDFGMKRIGVAVGQSVTKSARPLTTLAAKNGVPNWNILEKMIKKWQPECLIVGIPLNMDGTEQKISLHARQFAKELKERFKLDVLEVDERLTTKDAREKLFVKGGFKALQDGQVDQVAAQLILQNWFAEHSE